MERIRLVALALACLVSLTGLWFLADRDTIVWGCSAWMSGMAICAVLIDHYIDVRIAWEERRGEQDHLSWGTFDP